MRDIHLEDAFAPEPAMVHDRVERTLREVTTMTKTKNYMKMLALAAMMVLLASAACATVAGGVLDYVFGGGSSVPTKQQETMVQPIGVSGLAGGVTVTVTEAIFDGRMLAVGLCIDQRAYALPTSVTVNGQEASIQTVDECFLLEGLTGGFTAVMEEPVTGTVPVSVRVEVYTGDPDEEDAAERLGETELTFSLRADDHFQEMRLGEYAFAADVAVEEALVGDMQTRIALSIREVEGGMTMAEMQEKLMWFVFFGENREPAAFQDTWYYGGCGAVEQEDGSLVLVMEYTMPALETVPETLWVVPWNRDSSPEEPLWEYAIPLHPAGSN